LYLNVSIIFFLLLGITTKIDENNDTVNNIIENTKNLDSITQKGTKQLDSILVSTQEQLIKENSKDSTKAKVITDLGEAFKLIEEEREKSDKVLDFNISSDSTSTNNNTYKKIKEFYKYHKNFQRIQIYRP
jgi:flagellar motility protein MotE (MotC chaperone)